MLMHQLRAGLPVITASEIGEINGTEITPESVRNRQSDTPGIVEGFHPQHRGDVWLINHGDGKTAAYHTEELRMPRGSWLPDWVKSQ